VEERCGEVLWRAERSLVLAITGAAVLALVLALVFRLHAALTAAVISEDTRELLEKEQGETPVRHHEGKTGRVAVERPPPGLTESFVHGISKIAKYEALPVLIVQDVHAVHAMCRVDRRDAPARSCSCRTAGTPHQGGYPGAFRVSLAVPLSSVGHRAKPHC
jgi:hypothetical protein